MTTKISVIIPTLNEEKLILRTLNQFTGEVKNAFNLQVIISDGGSRDKTLKYVEGKADKVIEHKEKIKQNISGGRNKGAENSRGDVLVFLNADTYISDVNKFFEKILEFSVIDSASAMTFPIYVFPEEEKKFDKVFHLCYNAYIRLLNKYVMGMGRGECHIVKRQHFFDIGGYDEKLAAGEDFDLFKRLRKRGNIIFRNEVKVFESPRRYRKYGYSTVFKDWVKNAFWVLMFKKSSSEEWEAVR